VWRPVRRRFDARGFGVNAYTSEGVGQHIVEEHDEATGQEECYVVLRGRARFTLNGEEVDAPAGTVVFIGDSTVVRAAIAEEEDTAVLAVGGFTGKPFEISVWEASFAAIPYTRAERWEEAIPILEAGLRENPGHPAALYYLARVEARAGRSEDAIAHLHDALGSEPEWADKARAHADFDAIRDDPGFPSA
jgi:tetratricopeptide (TPR) repeat protein